MKVTNLAFMADMVRAIIREVRNPGTGKTTTRRAFDPQPIDRIVPVVSFNHGRMEIAFGPDNRAKDGGPKWWRPKAQAGDLIYVREAWRVGRRWDDTKPSKLRERAMTVLFEAGGSLTGTAPLPKDGPRPLSEYVSDLHYPPNLPDWAGKLRPAMFMPRWASRLTLEVTDVRVQRLQAISSEDSLAEGIECRTCQAMGRSACARKGCFASINEFRQLWERINGPDSWTANPWVAAYTFRPHLINIDAYLERIAAS